MLGYVQRERDGGELKWWGMVRGGGGTEKIARGREETKWRQRLV